MVGLEAPLVCRRLLSLRECRRDEYKEAGAVFSGISRARDPDGARASRRARVAMGCGGVDRRQDRLHGADATSLDKQGGRRCALKRWRSGRETGCTSCAMLENRATCDPSRQSVVHATRESREKWWRVRPPATRSNWTGSSPLDRMMRKAAHNRPKRTLRIKINFRWCLKSMMAPYSLRCRNWLNALAS
jgi:hypothetical protein